MSGSRWTAWSQPSIFLVIISGIISWFKKKGSWGSESWVYSNRNYISLQNSFGCLCWTVIQGIYGKREGKCVTILFYVKEKKVTRNGHHIFGFCHQCYWNDRRNVAQEKVQVPSGCCFSSFFWFEVFCAQVSGCPQN